MAKQRKKTLDIDRKRFLVSYIAGINRKTILQFCSFNWSIDTSRSSSSTITSSSNRVGIISTRIINSITFPFRSLNTTSEKKTNQISFEFSMKFVLISMDREELHFRFSLWSMELYVLRCSAWIEMCLVVTWIDQYD